MHPTSVSHPDVKAITVFLASTATPERGGLPYLDAVLPAEDRLAAALSAADLDSLRRMPEQQLINLHFGLALHIRNEFGLWAGNGDLLSACGTDEAAAASAAIVHALWARLQKAD